MWQNSIQVNPNNDFESVPNRSNQRQENMNPKSKVCAVPDIEAQLKRMHKINAISFAAGVAFMTLFFLLVIKGKIVLSGPYLPIYLQLFPQKLEFILRYQALGLLPIVINVLILSSSRMIKSSLDPNISNNDEVINRFNEPLQNSLEQFLMSTIIQMVMAANLEAEQVMVYCPFMAICFFIGRFEHLMTYPTYRHFGFALSFLPTLIAVLFNGYGALKFIFS